MVVVLLIVVRFSWVVVSCNCIGEVCKIADGESAGATRLGLHERSAESVFSIFTAHVV